MSKGRDQRHGGKGKEKDGAGDGGKVKFYSEEELAALVRSLDRKQDNRLFSEDVLKSYPHLAATYVKVCPQRCDLATAARNALHGAYSYEPDLSSLKADVRLMVNNCVRFNGDDNPLSAVAADFENFAMDKIQQYLESKTGGRRTSSLRFLQASSSSSPSASSPSAAGTGSSSDGSPNEAGQQQRQSSSSSSRRGGGASARAAEDLFPSRELVQLVSSLVRREDADAFVVDVAEVYPELREAYETVCPNKMHLPLMKQRAQGGLYNTTTPPVLGVTVADSLPMLRADIELVVGNCMRFNAQVEAWVKLARSFQSFAHRRVDDLVLRKAPQLRGTLTGAEKFTKAANANVVGAAGGVADGTSASDDNNINNINNNPGSGGILKRGREEDAAVDGSGAAKRKTLQWASSTSPSSSSASGNQLKSAAVVVVVAADVAPRVQPTPLQPALRIPVRLRRRLLADYLQRETVSLRLVGQICPVGELLPQPLPVVVSAGVKDTSAGKEEEGGAKPSDESATEQRERSDKEATAGEAEENKKEVLITDKTSAHAILLAFKRSVAAFFAHQRTRPDFTDPFQYNRQEEAAYGKVLAVMAEQFEALLPRALLYEPEVVALRRCIGHEAAQQQLRGADAANEKEIDSHTPEGTAAATTTDEESEEKDIVSGKWSSRVHYTYLVRFLVQFPQIASLSVASQGNGSSSSSRSSSISSISSKGGGLRISRDSVAVMQYVAKVAQEFLLFIEEFEEGMAKELAKA